MIPLQNNHYNDIPVELLMTVLANIGSGLAIVEISFKRDAVLPTAYFPITFANKSFAQMFGFENADSVRSLDIRSFVLQEHSELVADALQLGIPQTLSLPFDSSNGTRFHAQVQLSPIAHQSSRPTHVICTYTDITDIVQTNDALSREKEDLEKHIATRTHELQEFIDEIRNELRERRILEAELRMAEQRYRSLAMNYPNGVVLLFDTQKTCILCEGELAKKIPLNYSVSGEMFLDEKILCLTESSINAALRGEQSSCEISIAEQPFLVHSVPIYTERNAIDLVMLVLQDISDFKARQELEQEREMTALKYRFVTIASHELRTPLAGMMLSSGILRRYWDTTSEEEKRDSVQDIITGLDRMSKLVDDILFVGKSEAGKLPFAPQTFDICLLCNEYITECEKGIGFHHKTVREIPSTPLEIYADKKLTQLIFNNLLTNAYKYSPEGSEVRIYVGSEGNDVIIRVKDSGIGIPAEDIPNLFKSFHRGKNVGEIQGTGLGLAMVERAVEQHGGTISVESIERKGTTFEVRLPRSHNSA